MNWGTMPDYKSPFDWLDAFYSNYQANNGGRDPHIDYLAFHWYDYGLAGMLDQLQKYGKKIWVTEMANWHKQNDGARIDSMEKQKAQMEKMVNLCETRADVFRYAWFTGRRNQDDHYSSLFTDKPGQLNELGQLYTNLPFNH